MGIRKGREEGSSLHHGGWLVYGSASFMAFPIHFWPGINDAINTEESRTMMPSVNMLLSEKGGQSLFPSCGFVLSGLLKPLGSLLHVIPILMLC